jgi:hypothetical protein
MKWLIRPVTKQTPKVTPRAIPSWLVSRVDRSGDQNAPSRNGPRRSVSGGAASHPTARPARDEANRRAGDLGPDAAGTAVTPR